MRFNPNLTAVAAPPIADVQAWIEGVEFDPHRPLLDVAQAVPSYRPAPELERFIAESARQPQTARYTEILGTSALREALADHLSADYAAAISPSQVGICAGCNQAFCIAVSTLAAPGDEVILTLPYYFNHRMWLDMQGIRPVLMQMPASGPAPPNPDALADAITERTRAIVLVNPANPSGLEVSDTALQSVFEVAAKHGIALILDETYKDFRTSEGPPHGLFQNPDWPRTLIQLWSFSKSYALTGYRVGSVVSGNDALEQIEKVMDCVAICASRIGQDAALFGLTELAQWRKQKVAMMAQRRQALLDAFGQRNAGYQMLTCGAFFAYLRHPFGSVSGTEVAKHLARDHAVLCVPGDMFGPEQGPYLRLAFANLDTERVPELVERLAESAREESLP